ncbi:AAA family ATPase [Arcanobacterium bovis]|uniref:ATP-binding protein n=1 Tax=Arcanobacterium bovis TaxID=2529275 RepID=A0A4Q9V0B2_9ACTO|nr:ATP-binding protein [Arcanobacterium bovis]TBW20842.1 ATP-binding protein [Arcanobacterium bovis]
MEELPNPFTPSFGQTPDRLAGRTYLMQQIDRAFSSNSRHPELTAIYSGARGTGKTTLLSETARIATEHGWITASTTALPGMLDDIELIAKRQANDLISDTKTTARIKKLGIPKLVEVEFTNEQTPLSNWRSRMTQLLDALEQFSSGLLITVDEIDPTLDEMIELAAVYQHFVRENRRVALIMAGLPQAVSQLLSSKSASFVRRANIHKLGNIPDFDVRSTLLKTINDGGRTISDEALTCAVSNIGGFAYLLQLVGFRAWDISPTQVEITLEDVQQGVRIAQVEMEDRILRTTYNELSPSDIKFLEAMLPDANESAISDITTRLNWSSAQVGKYRRRLIDAGIIGERRRGVVGWDLPFFRNFIESMTQGIS